VKFNLKTNETIKEGVSNPINDGAGKGKVEVEKNQIIHKKEISFDDIGDFLNENLEMITKKPKERNSKEGNSKKRKLQSLTRDFQQQNEVAEGFCFNGYK
jgi:hypothetical protein